VKKKGRKKEKEKKEKKKKRKKKSRDVASQSLLSHHSAVGAGVWAGAAAACGPCSSSCGTGEVHGSR